MESPLAEQLQRISEQLKTAREKSGIELAQVAAQTFIPLRLLKAMDEGKFERLPEPVFVQGFIRRYGDAVGLDGKSLAQEFTVQPPVLKQAAEEFLSYHPEDDTAAPRNPRPSKFPVPTPPPAVTSEAATSEATTPKVNQTDAIPTAPPAISPPSESMATMPRVAETPAPSNSPGLDNKSIIYLLGGLAGLALFIIGAIALMQPKSGSDTNQAQSSTNQTTSQVQPSPTPTVSDSPQPSPTTAAAPLTLSVNVTDKSWVEVIADGQVMVSETLPTGTQQTWTAKERLSITAGNAQGVAYSFNQAPAKPMGTGANPSTLVFTPPGT